jgi:hypothetical protein
MSTTPAMRVLAHWRTVLCGWQLGGRPKGDAEADAVADHRQHSLMVRAEVNALLSLLIEKRVFTVDEWGVALASEAVHLTQAHERRFPGFRATEAGIEVSTFEAAETMKRMNFRP